MSFSKPVVHYGCEEKAKVNYRGGYGKFNMKENFPDIGGRKIVAYFDFDPAVSEELEVKVALSGVSTDGALKNLRAEASGYSFDRLAARAAGVLYPVYDILLSPALAGAAMALSCVSVALSSLRLSSRF